MFSANGLPAVNYNNATVPHICASSLFVFKKEKRFDAPFEDCLPRRNAAVGVALPVRAPGIIIALTDVMALSLKDTDKRASML